MFTGLLLTDAVLRKEVALGGSRAAVSSDEHEGAKLPRARDHPAGPGDAHDWVAAGDPNYSEAAANIGADPNAPLFKFLESLELTRPIGEAWSYSNLNYALIGIALSHCWNEL